jgi:hypothetical protein
MATRLAHGRAVHVGYGRRARTQSGMPEDGGSTPSPPARPAGSEVPGWRPGWHMGGRSTSVTDVGLGLSPACPKTVVRLHPLPLASPGHRAALPGVAFSGSQSPAGAGAIHPPRRRLLMCDT